ncbi:hypothetical protein EIP91_001729 [Steccherinum ochraceum]|uniref:RNA polymerase II-associated protein 3 n=1 Tax=Steccherinum ochraceum TaxID=92696 RepID=A0A4R0RDB9_9APHY|nr:hypothetical protein EIP91_001729 [Steccherinum ochraceum]
MPAKYSHAKKRPSARSKKATGVPNIGHGKDHRTPNVHVDRSITKAMSAVSQLERAIAQILLIRFEQDIARLFSTHLYCVALLHLPTFVLRCISVGGPSWVAANADCDEIKDFFRSAIGMDLRQAGERVATKSVLWSYTALRHFAMSNNVAICGKRGLHSLRLLPHYPALQAHLETLQAMPAPAFAKPPHLPPLAEGVRALEDACEHKYAKTSVHGDWDPEWRHKVRVGYERVSQTLWRVAREFDVRGYGLVLREKLTGKWCDCGCSTDHLSEVCEKTVREDEEESGVRPGKEREWDGRGSGVFGWETEEEEDIWEVDLDFVTLEHEECNHPEHRIDTDMTIGELMEWRYFRAEYEKEQGNTSFKKGDYETAAKQYQTAHQIEPEMPHYQLNLAAAYLKLQRWMEAEKACDAALNQHKSVKGHWRRAQARKAQGRTADAIKDLRAVLRLQPSNPEAQTDLNILLPPDPQPPEPPSPPPSNSSSSRIRYPAAMASVAASSSASGSSSYPSCMPSSSSSSSAFQSSEWTQPTTASHSFKTTTSRSTRGKSKPLPFARSLSDNRRLKITSLPVTIEVPAVYDPLPIATDHHHHKSSVGGGAGAPLGPGTNKAGKKVPFGNAKGKQNANASSAKGKGPAKSSHTCDLDDIEYRPQSFAYPSWERYSVKKVSD